MARQKSIVERVEVNEALKAHNCQHNSRHRIERGDKRLKVWKGRSVEYYCVACAVDIVEHDIAKLQEILKRLNQG